MLRIVGGRVIDPSQNLDRVCDLWIADGRVASIGQPPAGRDPSIHDAQVLDASGLLVVPGLVDMHVHLREPGDEPAETIASGALAALESGFTSLACMPDTEPAGDTQASAEFITLQASRAGNVNVWPVGAVTKNRAGEELAEMGGLVEGGAVAFTDSPKPVESAEIMRRALEYARMFDKPILSQPMVPELARNGIMNEGSVSVALGIPGIPAAAEEIMVDRDIHLAQWTGGRLHLQNLSCAGSLLSVRRAKDAGLPVTAEVCPYHLCLTEESLRNFDSNFKVLPPLRTAHDVKEMIKGLADGTIDVIASGHAPVSTEQKLRELDFAPFGVIGIETMLAIAVQTLIEPGWLTWPQLIAKMSLNPAQILGIDRGTLRVGKIADVTLLDPTEAWTVQADKFRSKSRNSPFLGWHVRGRARCVLVEGAVKFMRR